MYKTIAILVGILSVSVIAVHNDSVQARLKSAFNQLNSETGQKPSTIQKIACSQAILMLEQRGYRRVNILDCSGHQYTFEASRKNGRQVIVFYSITGRSALLPIEVAQEFSFTD